MNAEGHPHSGISSDTHLPSLLSKSKVMLGEEWQGELGRHYLSNAIAGQKWEVNPNPICLTITLE